MSVPRNVVALVTAQPYCLKIDARPGFLGNSQPVYRHQLPRKELGPSRDVLPVQPDTPRQQ